MRSLAFALVLVFLGCHGNDVVALERSWTASPASVDFGDTFIGARRSVTVTLQNESRAPLELTVQVDAPFLAPASLAVGGGASVEVPFVFAPSVARAETTVARVSDGTRVVELTLTGAGLAVPDCHATSRCRTSRFDPARGACVEESIADGVSCSSACLENASCVRGECVGASRSCDDHDECTLDACDPSSGCTHHDVSAACPASTNPCEAPVCRPATGCGFAAAPDGVRCGDNDCTTSHVCISGACETRAAPDGSECAAAGVCQAPSTCRQNVCVPGAITYPRERWRYAPANRRLFFEGTVDDQGTSYFTESSPTDVSVPLQLVALDRSGREKFRVELARGCLSCAARLQLDAAGAVVVVGRAGRVEGRSMVDGALLWSRDTTQGKPLRSPLPDGGGAWSSSSFVSLGADLVVEILSEGYEVHRQWAVALNRHTGQVAWEHDWWGHVYGPGATATNDLWVAAADCWAPVQQADVLDGAGRVRQTVTRPAWPIAFRGDSALLWNGTDLTWASPRGLGAPMRVNAGLSWVLSSPERTVIVAYQGAHELDADGGVLWSRSFGNYVSTGALVTDGGVIVSSYTNDAGATLTALGERGVTTFACPLPGTSSAGAPSFGMWIAQVSANGSEAIVGFDVGAPPLEPHGWVTPAGSPLNDRRPR